MRTRAHLVRPGHSSTHDKVGTPLDAPLDGDGHNGASSAQSVAHRDSDFCASDFAAILAQTPSISEFVRVRGNGSPRPFSFSLSGIELLLITCFVYDFV